MVIDQPLHISLLEVSCGCRAVAKKTIADENLHLLAQPDIDRIGKTFLLPIYHILANPLFRSFLMKIFATEVPKLQVGRQGLHELDDPSIQKWDPRLNRICHSRL